MKASVASCNANSASAVQRNGSGATRFPISLTRRANGSLRNRSSVDFWYFLISLSAFVPGRYLLFFVIPAIENVFVSSAQ